MWLFSILLLCTLIYMEAKTLYRTVMNLLFGTNWNGYLKMSSWVDEDSTSRSTVMLATSIFKFTVFMATLYEIFCMLLALSIVQSPIGKGLMATSILLEAFVNFFVTQRHAHEYVTEDGAAAEFTDLTTKMGKVNFGISVFELLSYFTVAVMIAGNF